MRTTQKGTTLVEVVMASSILAVGALGYISVMTTSIQMDSQTGDTTLAMRAAQDKLEEIWNLSRLDFSEVHSTFAGQIFDVDGLEQVPGSDGVGLVAIYGIEATAKAVFDLSMDLDLDRNGSFNEDAEKAPEDLRFLPVRIHLEWQSPFGIRSHDLDTFIYDREEQNQ